MGLFSSEPEKTAAIEAHKSARKALDDNARSEKRRGITEETDKFLRLNKAVADAERNVSWWRR